MKFHTINHQVKTGWSETEAEKASLDANLIFVFGETQYLDKPEPFNELCARHPNAIVLGCSTAGEFHDELIHDDRLSATVITFEKGTRLKKICVHLNDTLNAKQAAEKIANELMAEDLKGVFILSDGLNINCSSLVEGINSILPSNIVVTGGLAGDGTRFEKTWVLNEKNIPESHCISAIGFYGPGISIGYGTQSGWDSFGPERRVTKSSANVLYEIDGQPALTLYKKYLGDRANELPSSALLFPLSVRPDKSSELRVIRTILNVDESNQTMTFAGDIPEGYLCQFMTAQHHRLIQEASDSAKKALEIVGSSNQPELAIAVTCVGRRLILGEKSEEEIEAVKDLLHRNGKLIGFYSYGEICPIDDAVCALHNQTMTVTILRE